MYTCSRCGGSGKLQVFSHVLGGTCFKCNGTGKQRHKPSTPSPKWAVFGQHRTTGVWMRLYNVVAKTEQQAVQKALQTYERASADWKGTYSMTSTRALKWEDMRDVQALTWSEAV